MLVQQCIHVIIVKGFRNIQHHADNVQVHVWLDDKMTTVLQKGKIRLEKYGGIWCYVSTAELVMDPTTTGNDNVCSTWD